MASFILIEEFNENTCITDCLLCCHADSRKVFALIFSSVKIVVKGCILIFEILMSKYSSKAANVSDVYILKFSEKSYLGSILSFYFDIQRVQGNDAYYFAFQRVSASS